MSHGRGGLENNGFSDLRTDDAETPTQDFKNFSWDEIMPLGLRYLCFLTKIYALKKFEVSLLPVKMSYEHSINCSALLKVIPESAFTNVMKNGK